MTADFAGMGKRLRAAREKELMSQDDLALESGVAPSTISHIECGHSTASVWVLAHICDALGVSMQWDGIRERKKMSRKSIFTVVGGAALGLLIAAGILWVEPLAAEAEYVEEQEPVSPLVAEVIRQETPQKAAYTHESTMTVTAYCPCEKCCGAYSNGYTATGAKATQGVTIATDPDVIPLGTEVEIDGHIYIAQDVGGAVSGNRIDLYFDSHDDALQWGVQEKTARWNG